MTHDPKEQAWNSTLPKGKGFQAKPHWKGYKAGNSLADTRPTESKIAPRQSRKKGGRKRIKPVSTKTAARNREYMRARDAHMAANPWCVFPHEGGRLCGKEATDCHHREPRGIAPDRVVDPSNFVSLCRDHHDWVTIHPKAAKELGLLESSGYELRNQVNDARNGS